MKTVKCDYCGQDMESNTAVRCDDSAPANREGISRVSDSNPSVLGNRYAGCCNRIWEIVQQISWATVLRLTVDLTPWKRA